MKKFIFAVTTLASTLFAESGEVQMDMSQVLESYYDAHLLPSSQK